MFCFCQIHSQFLLTPDDSWLVILYRQQSIHDNSVLPFRSLDNILSLGCCLIATPYISFYLVFGHEPKDDIGAISYFQTNVKTKDIDNCFLFSLMKWNFFDSDLFFKFLIKYLYYPVFLVLSFIYQGSLCQKCSW